MSEGDKGVFGASLQNKSLERICSPMAKKRGTDQTKHRPGYANSLVQKKRKSKNGRRTQRAFNGERGQQEISADL